MSHSFPTPLRSRSLASPLSRSAGPEVSEAGEEDGGRRRLRLRRDEPPLGAMGEGGRGLARVSR